MKYIYGTILMLGLMGSALAADIVDIRPDRLECSDNYIRYGQLLDGKDGRGVFIANSSVVNEMDRGKAILFSLTNCRVITNIENVR